MKKLQKKSYYQVEQIIDKKIDDKGIILYFVKWKNWPSQNNTWEPYRNLSTVKNLIEQFQNQSSTNTKKTTNQQQPNITGGENKNQQQVHHKNINRISKIQQGTINTNAPVKRRPGRPPKIKIQEDQSQKTIIVNGMKKQIRITVAKPKQNKMVEEMSEQNIKFNKEQKIVRISKRKSIRKTSVNERKRARAAKQSIEKAHISSQEQDEDIISDEQTEELSLQQVLLQCQNYKEVKICFRQEKFYYQIPYSSNKQKQTFTTTAEQIIKINPKWLQGYFQGFYL